MNYNIIMNTMVVLFIIFILVSVFHVLTIVLKKEKLRRISKCLVIPLLAAVYISGGGSRFFFLLPALILGWVGDVLLLKIEKKAHFILGLASFLIGHIFYMITFIQILGLFGLNGGAPRINIPSLLIFTAPAVVLSMVVFRLIKPTKEMFLPVVVYMTVLIVMNLLGFQVFLFNPGIAGLLILSGCFNFIVSDSILAYYTFRKLKLLGAVLIMVYYILAQAEIVFGLMLL